MSFRDVLRNAAIDLEGVLERFTARSAAKQADKGARKGHILIAGPGEGSIGDEAMYEAFVKTCPGPLTVIARRPEDLLWTSDREDVEYVYLPSLLYGQGGRRAALKTVLTLAQSAESVSLVGADIMDGVYSEFASVRRFRTVAASATCGADARVLGFSWNNAPAPRARRAMQETSAIAQLSARDERSAERLRADGGQRVVTVSDLAFLTEPNVALEDRVLADWVTQQRAEGRQIVLVNANPRQEKRFPGLRDAYVRLIRTLLDDGISCILVPHDSRGGERSEEAYLAGIASEFATETALFHVENAPMPAQVVAIAREVDLVVSGRMHLVVLASVARRATVAFDYQDKFEGLYRLLGYDGRIAGPEGADRLVERVRVALTERESSEDALRASWPEVIRRSTLNLPFDPRTSSGAN
ncbi:polysaccharide pyruvyl transferase family protein [Microbacterium gilvum]|uniref:Polysaccharide pyruvyl transferase family protein n=1 Tax=Microbacterium gilvum TaxID=1336204 RepID=A0ABP9AA19_9MICO